MRLLKRSMYSFLGISDVLQLGASSSEKGAEDAIRRSKRHHEEEDLEEMTRKARRIEPLADEFKEAVARFVAEEVEVTIKANMGLLCHHSVALPEQQTPIIAEQASALAEALTRLGDLEKAYSDIYMAHAIEKERCAQLEGMRVVHEAREEELEAAMEAIDTLTKELNEQSYLYQDEKNRNIAYQRNKQAIRNEYHATILQLEWLTQSVIEDRSRIQKELKAEIEELRSRLGKNEIDLEEELDDE